MLLQVPFRRVHLQEANGHFDLYDTSGEQVMLLLTVTFICCPQDAWHNTGARGHDSGCSHGGVWTSVG